jgi:hypothetical protein
MLPVVATIEARGRRFSHSTGRPSADVVAIPANPVHVVAAGAQACAIGGAELVTGGDVELVGACRALYTLAPS